MKKFQLLLTIVAISCCFYTASAELYGPNLIVNGDFSAGNAGFTTDYVFVDPEVGGPNSLVPEGRYTVAGNAGDYHSSFVGVPFVGENFLIVNGATNLEICGGSPCDETWIVWQQTVEVEEGIDYEFSFMLSSLVTTAPANLNVAIEINGTLYAEVFLAPGATNEWVKKTWTNTDKSQFATITIIETTKVKSGNDFGIDDIVFRSIEPEPAPCPDLDVEIIVTDVTCPGDEDGIIKVIMNGVKPFNICLTYGCDVEGDDFEMFDKSQTATYGGLIPGYYTITIFDGNGCPYEVCVYVGEPEPLEAEVVNLVNPLCYGDDNGMVEIEITGGTPPYTADMGTVEGNLLTITGLGVGSYSVEIDDSSDCGSIELTFVIEEPTLLEATYEATEILCYGEQAEVTVFAMGGTPPYQLFDGDIFAGEFTDGEITLMVGAGVYLWTIIDANGCEAVVEFTIDQPDALNVDFEIVDEILCYGEEAQVAITVSGGTPPYVVLIGDFEPVEENGTFVYMLPAGDYALVVYDANQCSAGIIELTITQPPLLEAYYEKDEIACYGEQAEVTVFAMGGTPPYQLFDGDAFAGNFTDGEISLMVGAGEYLWTIIDANGCETQVEFEMTQPDPLVATLLETTDASCYGYEDGMAVISVTGGTPPYFADMGVFVNGTLTIEGLVAGEYTVTITDSKNCGPEFVTFEIDQPNEIVIENVEVEAPLCFTPFAPCTEPWAVAVIEYNVGTSNYGDGTVAESRTNPLNALGMPDYSNSPPITYVSLGLGGELILEVGCLIYNGEGADFEVVETSYGGPTCNSYPEKADIFVAQELDGPWSYLGEICLTEALDLSDGVDPDTGEPFILEWAKYIWIVDVTAENFPNGDGYDVNGIFIFNYLEEPVQFDTDITIYYSGVEEGEELLFTIYDGEEVVSISNVAELSGLDPGTYTVVLQVGECFSEPFEFTVPELPEPIVADAVVTDAECYGEATGTANITVSGGTAPYTLTWEGLEEPVIIAEDGGSYLITGLAPGSYSIDILDNHGCPADLTFMVGEPPVLTAEVELGEILCFGGDTWVELTIEGGVEPYLLSDNNSDFELEIELAGATMLSGFLAGDYSWTVTDANGCAVLVEFELEQPEQLIAEESYEPISCYGFTTDVTVTITNGVGPFMLYNEEVTEENLVIEFIDMEVTLYDYGFGTYFWIVVDANGCEAILDFDIDQPMELEADVEPGVILCYNDVTTALVTASGGTAPYRLFSGESLVATFDDEYLVEDLAYGAYSWTVLDANDCGPIVLEFELENPYELFLIVESTTDITCYGYDNGEIHAFASGGAGDLMFSLNGGEPQVSGSFLNLLAGDYMVTVTDANGCSVSEMVTLEEPYLLEIDVFLIEPTEFGQNNGEIWAYIIGGTAPYEVCLFTSCVEIDDDGEMYDKNQGMMYWGLQSGEYMIKVTDANGCVAYECVEVPVLEVDKIILSNQDNLPVDDVLITFPNPFRNQTTVRFTPQSSQFVSLEVYNVIGERVEILFQGDVNAFEEQEHIFRAGYLPNGIYYVRLSMDDKIHFDKVILAK